MTQHQPKSPTDKMRSYRGRLRALGLRPVQIWVPDVRAPHFLEEARRQSLRASGDPSERETLDFIDAVFDLEDGAA